MSDLSVIAETSFYNLAATSAKLYGDFLVKRKKLRHYYDFCDERRMLLKTVRIVWFS